MKILMIALCVVAVVFAFQLAGSAVIAPAAWVTQVVVEAVGPHSTAAAFVLGVVLFPLLLLIAWRVFIKGS